MNPEIKALWIEALRSGEYQQGKDQLKSAEGKYCCLGVLCDLARKEGLGEWRPNSDGFGAPTGGNEFVASRDELDARWSSLPTAVADWAGTSHDPVVFGGLSTSSLANLNDTGMSFEDIADVIESEM
jgi:hypothetical protein